MKKEAETEVKQQQSKNTGSIPDFCLVFWECLDFSWLFTYFVIFLMLLKAICLGQQYAEKG